MEASNQMLEKLKLDEYFARFKIKYFWFWIFVPFIFSIPIAILEKEGFICEFIQTVTIEYAFVIIPLLFVGISLKKFGLSLMSFFRKSKEKTSKKDFVFNIISEILFSIGTLIILGYIIQSVINFESISSSSKKIDETRTLANMGIHMYFIGCVLAPISEEILFRGILLNKLKIKYGVGKGLILSSLVFALVHFDVGILGRMIFGLIVGIMYLKTESLFPSILFHIIANSLLLLPTLLANSQHSKSEPIDDLITTDILISGLVMTFFSTIWLLHYFYKNWPRKRTEDQIYFIELLDNTTIK